MSEYIFATDAHGNQWVKWEEIVRCRDCKHYATGIIEGRRYCEPYCRAIGELAYGALFEVDEDDFCSWGEPRGDAQ